MLQMPTRALPRVTVGLRQPPSRSLLSGCLLSQMLAQILIHVGVNVPPHGQLDQQIDEVIIRSSQTSLCSSPMSCNEFSPPATDEAL